MATAKPSGYKSEAELLREIAQVEALLNPYHSGKPRVNAPYNKYTSPPLYSKQGYPLSAPSTSYRPPAAPKKSNVYIRPSQPAVPAPVKQVPPSVVQPPPVIQTQFKVVSATASNTSRTPTRPLANTTTVARRYSKSPLRIRLVSQTKVSPFVARYRSSVPTPKKGLLQRRLEAMNTVSLKGQVYKRNTGSSNLQIRRQLPSPSSLRLNNRLTATPGSRPSALPKSITPSKLRTPSPSKRKGAPSQVQIGGVKYELSPGGKFLARVLTPGGSTAPPLVPRTTAASPTQTPPHSRNRVFVPSRVSIGGVQYTKDASGAALTRTPTASNRKAASNAVKALLTRRQTSKSRELCLFFTRFGKCRSGDACRHIHDKDKVAVCKNFVNGKGCTDSKCTLTHKIQKEKMPVCYKFITSICSDPQCPYQHVKVNPNAKICGEFLKGYCPLGDQCKLKHTYECQHFSKYGVCPDGDKCRLKHAKRKSRPVPASQLDADDDALASVDDPSKKRKREDGDVSDEDELAASGARGPSDPPVPKKIKPVFH